MRTILFSLILSCFVRATLTLAGAEAVPNHYLFIVDTSSPMARTEDATADTVCSLILNGMDGQARPGDLVSIWTFNERVYTNSFPVQTWNPSRRRTINERVAVFLRSRTYEKRARMDLVVDAMWRALEGDSPLTIFILSDGRSPISGTPFDRDLNPIYERHERELRAARRPFVTVLLGRRSRLTDWAVHTGGGPVPVPSNSAPVEPPVAAIAAPASSPAVVNSAAPDAAVEPSRAPQPPVSQPPPDPAPVEVEHGTPVAPAAPAVAAAADSSGDAESAPPPAEPEDTRELPAAPVRSDPAVVEPQSEAQALVPETAGRELQEEPVPSRPDPSSPAPVVSDTKVEPAPSLPPVSNDSAVAISAPPSPSVETVPVTREEPAKRTRAASRVASRAPYYWIGGSLLLGTVIVILLMKRPPADSSFISRSLDRRRTR